MNSNKIKYLLFLVSLIWGQVCYSQGKVFSINIEYSPNFSKVTDSFINDGHKLSHNALFRIEYNSLNNINPTIGIGVLNTGVVENFDKDVFPTVFDAFRNSDMSMS